MESHLQLLRFASEAESVVHLTKCLCEICWIESAIVNTVPSDLFGRSPFFSFRQLPRATHQNGQLLCRSGCRLVEFAHPNDNFEPALRINSEHLLYSVRAHPKLPRDLCRRCLIMSRGSCAVALLNQRWRRRSWTGTLPTKHIKRATKRHLA